MIIRDDTSKQKTKQQLITECSNGSSVSVDGSAGALKVWRGFEWQVRHQSAVLTHAQTHKNTEHRGCNGKGKEGEIEKAKVKENDWTEAD